MAKTLFLSSLIFLGNSIDSLAQLSVQWAQCYGGPSVEFGLSIIETSDGGYVMNGFASSEGGQVQGHHGGADVWIVRVTSDGTLAWQRCLGGSLDETYSTIIPGTDSGYIVLTRTASTDGDVTGHNGDTDLWIIKLNDAGGIEWKYCLGGNGSEYTSQFPSIRPTIDGGYIIAGTSSSTNGSFSTNHGQLDAWAIKLSSSGIVEWQRLYGGTMDDGAHRVLTLEDGGYLLLGYTTSPNTGDVSGWHGESDIWVLRLDANGNIVWQKCLGGAESDSGESLLSLTDDSGFIVGGEVYYSTPGNHGDITGYHGEYDVWIVKLDAFGNLIWENCLGGDDSDLLRGLGSWSTPLLEMGNGNILVSANTGSSNNSGDVQGHNGNYDYWLIELNAAGAIVNSVCQGSTGFEGEADWSPMVLTDNPNTHLLFGTSTIDLDNPSTTDIVCSSFTLGGGSIWTQVLGGSSMDYATCAIRKSNGSIALCGITGSNDGLFAQQNSGEMDTWILELDVSSSINCCNVLDFSMQPNPATNHVNVSSAQGLVRRFRLLDIHGRVVATGNPAAQRFVIERNGLSPGTYVVELDLEKGRAMRKLMLD